MQYDVKDLKLAKAGRLRIEWAEKKYAGPKINPEKV